jgi:hypothetical protein
VQSGAPIWLDDGKIGGIIREVTPDRVSVEITQARPGGEKLAPRKELTFPKASSASLLSLRTTNRSVSWSTLGRPRNLRNFDPSNLPAMSFWYQASSVSGFATAANSSKAFRPRRWAISANVAFSASDNSNRPLIWAFRIRFSAARYSFLSRNS